MKQHYSEADLLETYYMRPGESMPVMMHLADCADCAARYERLEKKMQSLRTCAHEEKPETFWARQRISTMRKVDARRSPHYARIAAAAAIVIALTGVGVVTWDRPVADAPATVQIVEPAPLEDSPWASDELEDYSPMVEWESWVDNGDQS